MTHVQQDPAEGSREVVERELKRQSQAPSEDGTPQAASEGHTSGVRRRLPLTAQELHNVMADDGYSGDQRKAWLKQALTDLEQRQGAGRSAETQSMIDEVKAALETLQPEKPALESDQGNQL